MIACRIPKTEPDMSLSHYFTILFILLFALRFQEAKASSTVLPVSVQMLPADTLPYYFLFSGLSPAMISQGQWELNLFQALSTQKFHPSMGSQEVNRSTSLQQSLQIWHNPFRSLRFNIGFTFRLGHAMIDQQPDRSPLRVLGKGDEQSLAYHALAAVGPSLRVIPFRNLPEFSLQSSFLLPTAKTLETRQALGWDRSAFQLQAAFQQQLSPWLHGFLSAGTTFLFKNEDRDQSTYIFPAAFYVSARIAQSDWYVLPGLSYSTTYNDRFEGPWRHISSQWFGGLGVQYYPSRKWIFSLQFERSLGRKDVASAVELINRSFNQISLGIRYLAN